MDLPRIIIADEVRRGRVPAGVLVAAALKELGFRLRVFVGGIDETVLVTVEQLCGIRATMLDPALCEKPERLRWLFESGASEGALNIVLAPLGERWSDDGELQISDVCVKLYRALDCEIVPVLYSEMSSVFAVSALDDAMHAIRSASEGEMKLHAVLFRSILNPREYQLADREVGRRFGLLSIGAMPASIERDEPLLTDLCSPERTEKALIPLRSAARRLIGMGEEISWGMFSALAQCAPKWQHQSPLVSPIKQAGRMNIAVIRDRALSLGGNGMELMLEVLGANVVEVPLDGEARRDVKIHGVYIPHGLGYMPLARFFSNVYVKGLIQSASSGETFLLAEGGSSPMLGGQIKLPRGASGGSVGRGSGAFKFSSIYVSHSSGVPKRMNVMSRKRPNPLLRGSQEWAWGYTTENLYIRAGEGEHFCWSLAEQIDGPELAADGIARGRALATSLRMEPWGSPDLFRRWLEG